MQETESQIKQLADKICADPTMSALVSPEQLRGFLLGGLGHLVNRASLTERKLFLQDHPEDSANGFSPQRELKLGISPLSIQVPRTRSGDFYPALLNKYERTISGDYETILMKLLLNAKNFATVKRSLHSLGLPYRPDQLDELIDEIHATSKTLFSRRLDPDWFFLYIDAKCITMINESHRADQAVVFTTIGVTMDCKKEVLSIQLFWGNESTDLWKKVLHGLKNRGLTRLFMLITDDFSGLTPVVKSMLPTTKHQLCHVHLLRNALRHLDKDDYNSFKQRLSDLALASDFDAARSRFLELADSLKSKHSVWAKHLSDRADQFSAFAYLPRSLRPHIKSTNPVEGVNNHIEIIKRCSGGIFHSEREFAVKLKIMTDSLHLKWRNPSPRFKEHLHELHRLFSLTFESD